MPEISEVIGSDEEYEDAVSDQPSISCPSKNAPDFSNGKPAKYDAGIVEEQTKCIVNKSETRADNIASGSNVEKNQTDSRPMYICEEIDEKGLQEKETSMTPEELEVNIGKANEMKFKGNELFKNNQAEEAIEIYTEALKLCPLKATKERAVLYGNRAAAKIKLDSTKTAIDDCNKALDLWPEYIRVLLRRAKLQEHEDKLDEALADYKKVYDLDPGQAEAREAMVRLPPIIEERNERLKTEMLEKLKDLGNMILKPFGLSTSNFQMQQDPNTGSYSINFQNS